MGVLICALTQSVCSEILENTCCPPPIKLTLFFCILFFFVSIDLSFIDQDIDVKKRGLLFEKFLFTPITHFSARVSRGRNNDM